MNHERPCEVPVVWQDAGPPPWQTAIRLNRFGRAQALRRGRARRRAWLLAWRVVSRFLKPRRR